MVEIIRKEEDKYYFNFLKGSDRDLLFVALHNGKVVSSNTFKEDKIEGEYWWSPTGENINYDISIRYNDQEIQFIPFNKKIGIISSYTEKNEWTNNGKCDFVEVSSTNHMNYCLKHGYSYINEMYREEEYKDFHPTWIKIFSLLKNIDNYDYIVWIDSDCVFIKDDLKIEDLIQKDVDLILPKMEMDKNHGTSWTSTSTGFMVFKRSQWSKNLLQYLIDNMKEYRTEYFHEQTVLDNYLNENEYYTEEELIYKPENDLKDILFNENVGILPHRYHKCYNYSNTEFLHHASGDSPTKKERLINSLK